MAVEQATIRQDVFAALSTLLIANKPTYTYDGTEFTYNIVAEYNRKNPQFPLIVLNKAMITFPIITLDGETGDVEIEVDMEFFAKELHGKVAIDAGMDSAMNTILNNISTFIGTNKLIPQEDFWTDSGNSVVQDENQVLNTATSTARFKLG